MLTEDRREVAGSFEATDRFLTAVGAGGYLAVGDCLLPPPASCARCRQLVLIVDPGLAWDSRWNPDHVERHALLTLFGAGALAGQGFGPVCGFHSETCSGRPS